MVCSIGFKNSQGFIRDLEKIVNDEICDPIKAIPLLFYFWVQGVRFIR
jgi:hypothetical protein